MAERLCAYGPCACSPSPDRAYCDPECAQFDRTEIAATLEKCGCGHETCRPEFVPERKLRPAEPARPGGLRRRSQEPRR